MERGWYSLYASGSSPLARGLHRRPPGRRLGRRIIPARAGFTPSACRKPRSRPDHPRSRGVYPWPRRPPSSAGGSSPLARGLLTTTPPSKPVRGIIPARAGFTRSGRAYRPSRGDHPRSRGVYRGGVVTADFSCGSSPLARGLPGGARQAPGARGIIPARAGFTPGERVSPCDETDHPRSRGVYPWKRCGPSTGTGSSPLARGLPSGTPWACPTTWIIPARAGFTTCSPLSRCALSDHPRSRGVYYRHLSLQCQR